MKLQYFYESFRFQQKKNRISLSFKKKEKEFSKFLILDIYYFVIPTKAGIQFIKLERIMRLPHIFFLKKMFVMLKHLKILTKNYVFLST